jgi:CheY-like chemotaxis protein
VTLPSNLSVPTQSHVAADGEQTQEHASLAGLDILVVDDDEDGREVLTIVLESRGATVRAVSSVSEALDALQQHRPDVVVADLRMPGEDGYSLIRKVRARERQQQAERTPAVAVTAYASATDREKALAAEYDWHVAKPIDPETLARVVARLSKTSER